MRRYFRGILKSVPSSKPPWRTPDHPPYSQMIEVALRGLSEEGGSTESSISSYIQSTFPDLPWGHDRLLPYYLSKLVVSGELSSTSHGRYQLPLHGLHTSAPSLARRRGRPLCPTNPSSYSKFYPFCSGPPRSRARSRLLSSRGRSLEKGSAPLRGRPPLKHKKGSAVLRGRPPLKHKKGSELLQRRKPHGQEGAAGEAAMKKLVRGVRRSKGSTIRKDGSMVCKLSPISAFCDGVDNGGGESAAALENLEGSELIHTQILPGNDQLPLTPEQISPVKCLPLSVPELPEFPERSKGLLFQNADTGDSLLEIAAFSNEKTTGASEKSALDDLGQSEYGDVEEGQPFLAAQLVEHGEGQFSPARDVPLLTLEPVKISFLATELSDYGKGKSHGEAPSPLFLEPSKLIQEQRSPGEDLPLLSSPKLEINDIDLANSEDGHEKLSLGKRSAPEALLEGQSAVLALPVEDEIKSHGVKRKKDRRSRRRLRLWFEG